MEKSRQQIASLRCCASCEWIYKNNGSSITGCPMCGFGSYGARFVHGDKAYRYHRTQEPWKARRLAIEAGKLEDTIRKKNDWKPTESEQRKLDARDRAARLAFYEESMGRP